MSQTANSWARVIDRSVFIAAPPCCVVHAQVFYTHRTRPHLLSMHGLQYREDTNDWVILRRSTDNGQTWEDLGRVNGCEAVGDAFVHRRMHGLHLDPKTGRCVQIRNTAILPTNTSKGSPENWQLAYCVFEDGGPIDAPASPIVHEGDAFDEDHPLPGIYRGRSGAMVGDIGSRPITLHDGTLLVPFQLTRLGDDGKTFNPHGAMTCHDSAVLLGRWHGQREIRWRMSSRVQIDPDKSYRGLIEPTVAVLDDNRLLMVLRGSNSAWPAKTPADIPGYKWCSFSHDGGQTWSPVRPWTDTLGEPFFSPSSCSYLFEHSSGRLLWCGNVSETNPTGNSPRYPLVIAQVDRATGLLIRSSITVLDTRQPGESDRLTLSNFCLREERGSGHLIIDLPRIQPVIGQDGSVHRQADASTIRVALC